MRIRTGLIEQLRSYLTRGSGRFDPSISPIVVPVVLLEALGLESPGVEPGVTGGTVVPSGVVGAKIPIIWVPTGDGIVVTLAAGAIRTDLFQVAEGSGTEYFLDYLAITLFTGATNVVHASQLALNIAPYGAAFNDAQGFRSDQIRIAMRLAATSTRFAVYFYTPGFSSLNGSGLKESWRWISNNDSTVLAVPIPRMRLFVVPGQAGGAVQIRIVNSGGNSSYTEITVNAVLTAVAKGAPG